MEPVEPTERELAILKILWDREEATVREVYEILRQELPIVQNTVQAFLRTMTEKGLVAYRNAGRTFVYRPVVKRQQTRSNMVAGFLRRVFDGSLDQLVESAVSLRTPGEGELSRLRELLDRVEKTSSSAAPTTTDDRGGRR